MNNKFIILDRDGVINHATGLYVKTPEELVLIPGSLAAIVKLNQAGFKVLVATNQSGIGRGLYNLTMLGRIHARLSHELSKLGGYIHDFFCCPHHPDEDCICRKPKPGMLSQIKEKYAVDLANTFFVGDSDVDMQVAASAGCKPVLVLTGRGLATQILYPTVPAFVNLAAAVDNILEQYVA